MGRSSVLTADNFSDIANRASIDLVLSRLAQRGTVRRIARGLYLYPKAGLSAGEAAPSVQSVASAIAKAGRMRLQPSGAYAANLLGLSEQVPMKVVFLTDGGSRRILVGRALEPSRTRSFSSGSSRTAGRCLATPGSTTLP